MDIDYDKIFNNESCVYPRKCKVLESLLCIIYQMKQHFPFISKARDLRQVAVLSFFREGGMG